jgi:hypothetical protein
VCEGKTLLHPVIPGRKSLLARQYKDPKWVNIRPPQNGTDAACGYTCHTTVAAKDYIFTAYPQR